METENVVAVFRRFHDNDKRGAWKLGQTFIFPKKISTDGWKEVF
jgi:hypothetical protein